MYLPADKLGGDEMSKSVSIEERDELSRIFTDAVTGSGGTITSGIDAMLIELGFELESKPVEVK